MIKQCLISKKIKCPQVYSLNNYFILFVESYIFSSKLKIKIYIRKYHDLLKKKGTILEIIYFKLESCYQ